MKHGPIKFVKLFTFSQLFCFMRKIWYCLNLGFSPILTLVCICHFLSRVRCQCSCVTASKTSNHIPNVWYDFALCFELTSHLLWHLWNQDFMHLFVSLLLQRWAHERTGLQYCAVSIMLVVVILTSPWSCNFFSGLTCVTMLSKKWEVCGLVLSEP